MAQPSYPPFAPVSQPSNNPGVPVTPLGYPPVSPQPGYPTAPQPGYPTAPQPGYMAQPPFYPSYPPQQPVQQTSYAYTAPAATMLPQPSHTTIIRPIPVLGPHYCLPHLVDLVVTKKLLTLTEDFVVTDLNKNVMFKVKGKIFSLHEKRVLLDAAGNPVVTLCQKILSAHSRWYVYRGRSTDARDLIFTAKTSSIVQLRTKLNVYLANRNTEDVSDFRVEGSWSERSCVIYVGESTTIAAQMHMRESAQSFFLGRDTFMVTVYPNIDYAFVVALIVILDAVNSRNDLFWLLFFLEAISMHHCVYKLLQNHSLSIQSSEGDFQRTSGTKD
ncbi:hypothetical protein ACH5RR_005141 [Cinchona calisaya]|uniref:Uncharacterized protein n=1 Tax=Cinchona calisaya TaxID=153742 RepID=A0ABD3AKC1_9GENT